MTGVTDVLGRDAAAEAYRVVTAHGTVLVPEVLMGGLRPGERPSHEEAYRWIVRNAAALDWAAADCARGRVPKGALSTLVLLDRGRS